MPFHPHFQLLLAPFRPDLNVDSCGQEHFGTSRPGPSSRWGPIRLSARGGQVTRAAAPTRPAAAAAAARRGHRRLAVAARRPRREAIRGLSAEGERKIGKGSFYSLS